MAVERIEQELEIKSTPKKCYEIICDFESYPEWQQAVESVTVLNKTKSGRPWDVEIIIKAVVKRVRYVIRYEYDDKENKLSWTYVEGDVKNIEGTYSFEKKGKNSTLAKYNLAVDPGLWIPKAIKNTLINSTMKGSMNELKTRVESKK